MKTYYQSNPIFQQAPSSIDRENGIIKGIVIVSTGEAKGHGVFLDDSFIADVEKFGNEKEVGIKARFGHPNICSTALGTYLGRYRNFRKAENKVLADLYLDKSAIKSPKGNLYEYIIGLAETNPDMFGASIAFKSGKDIIRKVDINGEETDRRFATIESLYAIDFVDDPAVTSGLFQVQYDDFASQVTSFLDGHPEVFKLLDEKPEIFEAFMTNYKSYNENKHMNIKEEISNLKKLVSENFSKSSNGGHTVESLQSEFNSKITTLEAKLTDLESLEKDNSELETCISSLSERFKATFIMLNQEDDGIFNSELPSLDKLQNFNTALAGFVSLIQSKDDEIAQLQSKLNKSLANPTIPNKTADPLLTLETKKESDLTGRIILQNIPDNAKRKLKQV